MPVLRGVLAAADLCPILSRPHLVDYVRSNSGADDAHLGFELWKARINAVPDEFP